MTGTVDAVHHLRGVDDDNDDANAPLMIDPPFQVHILLIQSYSYSYFTRRYGYSTRSTLGARKEKTLRSWFCVPSSPALWGSRYISGGSYVSTERLSNLPNPDIQAR